MLFSEAKELWQNLESPWDAGWTASGVGCAATQTEVLPPSSSPWGALPHFRLKTTSLAPKTSSERWDRVCIVSLGQSTPVSQSRQSEQPALGARPPSCPPPAAAPCPCLCPLPALAPFLPKTLCAHPWAPSRTHCTASEPGVAGFICFH